MAAGEINGGVFDGERFDVIKSRHWRDGNAHRLPNTACRIVLRQQGKIIGEADLPQRGKGCRVKLAIMQKSKCCGIVRQRSKNQQSPLLRGKDWGRAGHTLPLLCGMKAIDGRVNSGLAMFLTCRTGLSCGPMAVVGCVPFQSFSMGPTSSTRIMQAMTQ